MRFVAFYLAILLPVLAITSPARAAENNGTDPAQTVQAFYNYHFKHDMGFGVPEVKARKAWLEPELYALIMKVLKKSTPKGDAPDIDGDIFTDSQEYPTSFHVGKATVEGETARVDVTLVWSAEKRHVTMILKHAGHAWLISNIEYGEHRAMTKDLLHAAR